MYTTYIVGFTIKYLQVDAYYNANQFGIYLPIQMSSCLARMEYLKWQLHKSRLLISSYLFICQSKILHAYNNMTIFYFLLCFVLDAYWPSMVSMEDVKKKNKMVGNCVYWAARFFFSHLPGPIIFCLGPCRHSFCMDTAIFFSIPNKLKLHSQEMKRGN